MNAKTETRSLVPVIHVDEDKCVNCHMCIAVCPVKYCIDGKGDKVAINHDLCIGCGSCVRACKQKARSILDDMSALLEALARKEPVVAIAAPALISSFEGSWRNFLGWLKKMGVAATFDVSFGAELTVKSYLDHIDKNKPSLVIAQPCPAIVSYIELYRPELIGKLAPADSPMLHTAKMIREFYPAYAKHRILVLSPCAAKKREFQETGIGDFNVTFQSFRALLDERKVDLSKVEPADFENPPAERGVLFSTPGGLLRTALRDAPGIGAKARKIEGPELIYPYLDKLGDSLEKGRAPLLVDCLNCDFGCNAGPGTLNLDKSPDEFEGAVEKRREEAEKHYSRGQVSDKAASKKLGRVLERYWKPGLYARRYVDRSANYKLAMPSERQFKDIYERMLKKVPEDHLNCASCGYKSCEGMAIAIFNNLNKIDNCHLYREKLINQEKVSVVDSTSRLHNELETTQVVIERIRHTLAELDQKSAAQFAALQESASAVEEMIATLEASSGIAKGRREQVNRLSSAVQSGESDIAATVDAIKKVSEGVSNIGEMIGVIQDVADKTNMLSMNAAIQAAHAGTAGKSFAVVASEIRVLAEATGENALHISASLGAIIDQIKASDVVSARTGTNFHEVAGNVSGIADEMTMLLDSLGEMAAGGTQVTKGIEQLRNVSSTVMDLHKRISTEVGGILKQIDTIKAISEETQSRISKEV